jgi:hypothetical protein
MKKFIEYYIEAHHDEMDKELWKIFKSFLSGKDVSSEVKEFKKEWSKQKDVAPLDKEKVDEIITNLAVYYKDKTAEPEKFQEFFDLF